MNPILGGQPIRRQIFEIKIYFYAPMTMRKADFQKFTFLFCRMENWEIYNEIVEFKHSKMLWLQGAPF